jgi:hypothetical protein
LALEKSARKLRQAAEREALAKTRDGRRRVSDTEAAEAHREITNPEHTKARPTPRKSESHRVTGG